jgi:tRNA(fMet)-specific endonuclease VapC
MIYLLDTDTFILLSRGTHIRNPRQEREKTLVAKARKISKHCTRIFASGEIIGLSAISLAELEYGLHHGGNFAKRQSAHLKMLAPFEAFPFDAEECVRHYGKVREDLESKGTPIGPLDTLIAAHALALGATLVTNNTREFQRVSGLNIANWTL